MQYFYRGILHYVRDEKGVTAMLGALVLPVVMGMAGLGVDASSWFMSKRDLQTAADAAALAAAYEIANGSAENAENAAMKEARNNGLADNGTLDLSVSEGEAGSTLISVELSQSAPLWFSKIFVDSISVGVTAEAEYTEENDGSACILSLDETEDQALKTSGNVEISMPNCGIAVNSDSDQALYMNGNVNVEVADARIHGGYDTVGSVEFTYDSLRTGANRVEDPYADLDVPPYSECSSAAKRRGTRVNSDTTLQPGVYCGGITVTGNNNVTFAPGVYILDGGSFNVTGGGSLSGDGVSFVMTNSPGSGSYGNVDISGGRTVNFSAPEEGEDMEGVVFYQDRNAPETGTNRITGNAEVLIDGAAYFPSQEVTIGGTSSISSSSNPCSRVIGRLVTLHGTPNLSNSCDGSASRDISMPGTNSIRLVN